MERWLLRSCHTENIRSNTKCQRVCIDNRSPFAGGPANTTIVGVGVGGPANTTIVGVGGTAAEPV